jgi:peptide chain release factor 3
MAGQVRAKGEARRTRSDFMQMEKDRGISVSASAMSFDMAATGSTWSTRPATAIFRGHLPHADRGGRGDHGDRRRQGRGEPDPEAVRGLPPARPADPDLLQQDGPRKPRHVFEIIDEIQENLAIDVTPASWPIGMGRDFLGCYDLIHDRLELMDRADRNKVAESIKMDGLDDPQAGRAHPRGPAGAAARRGGDGARAAAALDRRSPSSRAR